MKAIGRDADLRAHAELAAVGELRRSIVQHDGAVYPIAGTARAVAALPVTMLSVCAEP